MKKEQLKSRGITLIALVITIIVLLILAGVTIVALSGDNGILQNATKAKEETEKAEAKEKVQLEVMNSYDEAGQFDMDKFKENLKNNLGLQDEDIKDNGDGSITVTVDGYEITVDSNGNVKLEGESEIPVDPPTTGKTDGSFDEEKGVNTPKLKDNMKLVVYDNGNWVEDTTKSAYSYQEQAGATDTYNEETGEYGTSHWANAKVTIDGVESYFVWIPRYAYKITYNNPDDKTQGGTIDIKFIKGTGTEATDGTECKYADDKKLDISTDYIIHPAFTANKENGGWSTELSGIWVGKYETSLVNKEDGSNINTSSSTIGNILLSDNIDKAIAIQPNKSSWRYCTIGNMYTNAKEYSPNLNSHMLKNSEWGAVAYLTHSKYGRNGTEIAVNNSSDYITGTSGGTANASSSGTKYVYNDATNGVLASSTGNVYGIYDLSGGAYEYVAAYYSGSTSSNFTNNGSELVNETNREYVTAYDGTDVNTDYKQGDATNETKSWNGDDANFVVSLNSFFRRGGYYSNASAGSFSFVSGSGSSLSVNGFRVCLAVQ